MDHALISTSRVRTAFALTAFVALVPALFLVLQSGAGGPFRPFTDADELVLGAGSVLLTGLIVGVLLLTGALARRMVRRPSRA